MDTVAKSLDSALGDEGTLLKPQTRQAVEVAYSMELVRWASLTDVAKAKGASKLPIPKSVANTITTHSLCELSLASGVAC